MTVSAFSPPPPVPQIPPTPTIFPLPPASPMVLDMRLSRGPPKMLVVKEIMALDDQRQQVPLRGITLQPPAPGMDSNPQLAFNGIRGDCVMTNNAVSNEASLSFTPVSRPAKIRMLVLIGPNHLRPLPPISPKDPSPSPCMMGPDLSDRTLEVVCAPP